MDATTVLGADPSSGQPPRPRLAPPGPRPPGGPSAGATTGTEPAAQRLPRARVVDRDEYLLGAAAGRAVTHVGFAAAGMRRDGRSLHARLAGVAASLVGVDQEPLGVAAARAAGYEAHQVDCADAAAVTRAGIRPAELLLVTGALEQADAAGPFLDGLRRLAAPDATLILTTPNAGRLLNTAALLAGRDLTPASQVAWYSWRTLVNLLERHSWWVVGGNTYQAPARGLDGAASLAVAAERTAARLVAPFLANGLIAVCRPLGPSSAARPTTGTVAGTDDPAARATEVPVAPPTVGQRQP